MSYHHRIDPAPEPEKVIYINETWIADNTIQPRVEDQYQPQDLINDSSDNIRVYVPLDISLTAVLRRLSSIVQKYGELNKNNEVAFESV